MPQKLTTVPLDLQHELITLISGGYYGPFLKRLPNTQRTTGCSDALIELLAPYNGNLDEAIETNVLQRLYDEGMRAKGEKGEKTTNK